MSLVQRDLRSIRVHNRRSEMAAQDQQKPGEKNSEAVRPNQGMRLDTSQLKSSYCNVCNATSTREEVVLNFGVNSTWDLGGEQAGRDVQLHHRIILSPFAAKRLAELLNKL